MAEIDSLAPEQRRALLADRYAALMAPLVVTLERNWRSNAATEPETPSERRFLKMMLPQLRTAIAAFKGPPDRMDYAKPQVRSSSGLYCIYCLYCISQVRVPGSHRRIQDTGRQQGLRQASGV